MSLSYQGVRPPTLPTLRRYGLTLEAWVEIGERQKWRCPICERHLGLVPRNIDHEHVIGWKKLPDAMRALFVRGILCARCNWKVVPDPTPSSENIERLAAYLRAHEKRRAAARNSA